MPNDLISIVEDDESMRLALIGLFRSAGYEARGFASAEDFLAVRDERSGCIVSDLHMPGLSGIEMVGRLRALDVATPVILITAREEAGLEAQARASGAIGLLRKPFDPCALLDCVERLLTP